MAKKRKKGKYPLTPKQEAACQEFVKCGDKSAAYKHAYNTENYKPETINRAAHRFFGKSKIVTRVKQLQAKAAERNDITVDRILQEEKRISYLDPAELFKLEKKEWTLIPVPELPEDIRRAIASFEVKELTSGVRKGFKLLRYKYKFNDKGKSLERTSRHLGMYNDKLLIGLDTRTLGLLLSVLPEKYATRFKEALMALAKSGGK